ncbi:hypothetical protein CDD82_2160 [Ophiocordyceps australis]|uniref:F-box domain-containing protein n=1 Tax=Ophiocordyceps australis TaxID=1399860 RepID=A0A2C5ZK89_9HYPO|nr:hypothetical protein CDD82_2160 [Ophiocordyceps australis]
MKDARTGRGRRRANPRHTDTAPAMPISWPAGRVPVEIFELIASYLSRHDVMSMRLVGSEFEAKTSAFHFRSVVVPFRAELYHTDHQLLSDGMRVFQSFGPHIIRFALSLEVNEDLLAAPPLKTVQHIVPSFWGLYRWPQDDYRRYQHLEGIERTADEMSSMKAALGCLSKVKDIGLCCDAGLGLLYGPNRAARNIAARHPVFTASPALFQSAPQPSRSPCPNSSSTLSTSSSLSSSSSSSSSPTSVTSATPTWLMPGPNTPPRSRNPSLDHDDQSTDDDDSMADALLLHSLVDIDHNKPKARRRPRQISAASLGRVSSLKRLTLTRMMSDAGYVAPRHIDEAIRLLLSSEKATLYNLDLDDRSRRPCVHVAPCLCQQRHAPWHKTHSLTPASLTVAQMELLLELEWAHRAMMQSYVIGLIDNASVGSLTHLTSLTIAKIPSSHLHIFCRHDFWDSIPTLDTVSLAVIADWRRVVAMSPGLIEDRHLSPVGAVSKAYDLLNIYIGQKPNIRTLHFEWICGGELAPGTHQRNLYVLPAPLFDKAEKLVAPGRLSAYQDEVLDLPHVSRLSLKNCWVSPHVLLYAIRRMARASLIELGLESVSLTAPPVMSPQPPLATWLRQHFRSSYSLAPFFPPFNPSVQSQTLPAWTNTAALHPPPPVVATTIFTPLMSNGPESNWLAATWAPPLGSLLTTATLGSSPAPAPNQGEPSTPYLNLMSWLGLLYHFSPRPKLSMQNVQQVLTGSDNVLAELSLHLPEAHLFHSNSHQDYGIKILSLKSCGYVAVDQPHLYTRNVLPADARFDFACSFFERRESQFNTLQHVMQYSNDKFLGLIIPHIKPQEQALLVSAFGMSMGWDGVYPRQVIDDALADRDSYPGQGRFSGLIQSSY